MYEHCIVVNRMTA